MRKVATIWEDDDGKRFMLFADTGVKYTIGIWKGSGDMGGSFIDISASRTEDEILIPSSLRY